MRVIKFRVSNLWLGVDVLAVEAVTRCPEPLEEVRHTREVVGTLPFHGRSVPLVELAPWLGLRSYYTGERHVVVLDLVRVAVGLLVGEVEDIVTVETDPALPLPAPGRSAPELLRTAHVEGSILHLLEPEVFFRHEHLDRFAEAARAAPGADTGPGKE